MLDLAGIPLLSKDRSSGPFICAGGPCAFNPEPLADIIDFFVIGECEEVINEILDTYAEWKKSGNARLDFLEQIAKIEGVYVPLLRCVYKKPHNLGMVPNNHCKKDNQKKIVKTLTDFIPNPYRPYINRT
jgi:radical SAM superfamily enzyme YgiQ (UPF0313 family)